MKNINILIKPASQKCNIDCKYCFYHDIANNRETPDFGSMLENTYKAVIDKALEYVDKGAIGFAFQGGEPTLVGVEFYQKFISYVNEKNLNDVKIKYSIQTNGTLLTQKFCDMFKENNFLVGLSLDGTRKLNDINRIDYKKEGTYFKVIRASSLLNKNKIPFNILTVVSKTNVMHLKEILKFYSEKNFKYIQFIPCLDSLEDTKEQKYALTNKEYLVYLKTLFDYYYETLMNDKFISERYMDNILGMYLNQEPESCMQKGVCSLQLVVEGNGEVFPCDFYAFDNYSIGNFNDNTVEELIKSEGAQKFIKESFIIHPKCQKCKFLKVCRGGCKRDQKKDIDGNGLNKYCDSLYEFHEYSSLRFIKLAKYLSEKHHKNSKKNKV